jgi:GT2 family glycosyltransferase
MFPHISCPASTSVIIPTFNRAAALENTLEALTLQDELPEEVIVIDDGSTDGTANLLATWSAKNLPFELICIHTPNAGPASARNMGIRRARGAILGFLGDDTIPEKDWLRGHMNHHRCMGPHIAVVGYTDWDKDHVRVTPYLRYINESGAQFGYGYMQPGKPAPFTSFYSSNLSISREALGSCLFNESFTMAMWEDTELGYRLSRSGVSIIYEPQARTKHRHPLDMKTFLRRQREAGIQVHKMLAIHPELNHRLTHAHTPWFTLITTTVRYLTWLQYPLYFLDKRNIPLPALFYRAISAIFYLQGIREGISLDSKPATHITMRGI